MSIIHIKTMSCSLTYRGVKYSKGNLKKAVAKHAKDLSESVTPLVYRRINYRPEITVTKEK